MSIPVLLLAIRSWPGDGLEGVSFSREVQAEKGELLRLTLSSDEKYRIFRPFKEIHHELREAVLLSEDRYFYYHPGFNPVSLVRSLFSLGEDRKIGGSTITMQMVRLKHKLYTRSIWGKLQQIAYAVGYELRFSKKQILEAYLNLTPYGGNIEGVEAASRIYFGKPCAKLSLLESLTLAVIPQNPLKRSLNQEALAQVDRARKVLLDKWLEQNPGDRGIVKEARLPVISNRSKDLPFRAPHFVEEVLGRYSREHLIRTSLNWDLQQKIEERLQRYIDGTAGHGIKNAAAVLVEAATGQVKAWVGSRSFFDSEISGQIDGISVLRSPGSTLKPFIYGRAIDQGIIHPGTLLKDSPASFGTFDPENFDRRYLGPISATQALIQSRNVPAILLTSQIDSGYMFNVLKDIGVPDLRSQKFYGLGITLGTAEMSPLNLASLYVALARRGRWRPLHLKSGEKEAAPIQILSPESSFMVLNMLSQAPREQNVVLNDSLKQQYPMAWKTGTSYGFRDAWTAGVFGPYVLVVWLGNFDYSENPHLIGREMAAPLFFQIADLFPKKVLQDHLAWSSSFGLNLKKVEVCDVSGALPNESCPHRRKEYFIPARSPIETCQLHRSLMISAQTGLRLCGQKNQAFRSEVFEFWPSDILEIFRKFGVSRRTPPAYDPSCSQVAGLAAGMAPEILSPKRDLDYLVSFAKSQMTERIPLRAMTDADVKEVSWFANKAYVGTTRGEDTLFFEASPGTYDFIVVDDQGRTSSRKVEVSVTR